MSLAYKSYEIGASLNFTSCPASALYQLPASEKRPLQEERNNDQLYFVYIKGKKQQTLKSIRHTREVNAMTERQNFI